MRSESRKSDNCACRCATRCNITLTKISCIMILFSIGSNAQNQYTAQLSGPDYPIQKDAEYFWEQSRQQAEKERAYYAELENEGGWKSYYNAYDYFFPDYQREEPLNQPDLTAQYEAVDETTSDYVDRGEKPCLGENGCSKRRVSLEEAEAMMVATVKRNILHALKMTDPPNGTHPKISLNSPPIKQMMRLHGMKEERSLDDEYDDDPEYQREETSKETVISYAREPLSPGQSGSYFKFNEDDLIYNVESAVIWFYVKANPSNRTNITIDFYRYQQNTTHPDASPVKVKFDRKIIHTQRKGHWRQMSVKHIVSKWFINPETNLGMDIRCREIPGLVFSGPVPEHDDKKPILEVALSHSAHSRRRKRDVDLMCTAESNQDNCCRYEISISFEKMGWNWIISPKGYTTHYCSGDCPTHYLESNQNRMLELMPASRPPGMKACCTPTVMAYMYMLYWDNENNIIYSSVPNMRVKKCGCK